MYSLKPSSEGNVISTGGERRQLRLGEVWSPVWGHLGMSGGFWASGPRAGLMCEPPLWLWQEGPL